ncbi:hypothetical protein HDU85_000849 [Gaertneriomyces sp. JEL0708]|nr:hypothetical protein HDU85_000849 [Gaertneriomyces sp. JEL0708]
MAAPSTLKRIGKKIKEYPTVCILVAALLAIGIGITIQKTSAKDAKGRPAISADVYLLVGFLGSLWLQALKATLGPLILSSIINSVYQLRTLAGAAGKAGKITILYYLATTVVAVGFSLAYCSMFILRFVGTIDVDSLPDIGSDTSKIEENGKNLTVAASIVNIFAGMVPKNVVGDMSNDALLAVIVLAIIIGACIESTEENPSVVLRLAREVEKIVMKCIHVIIAVTPIGVFFLVLPPLMAMDFVQLVRYVGILVGVAWGAFLLHLLVFHPLIYFISTRRNPYRIWKFHLPALTMAFGCDSSAATIPFSLECVEKAGVPADLAKFVIPLGATINMDGGALYLPMAVSFMAATQGVPMPPATMFLVGLIAVLASIGTAPIPSASMVFITFLCRAADVPVTGVFGLIFAVDWFLDRGRTTVNVNGDLYATSAVYHMCKDEITAAGMADLTEFGDEESKVPVSPQKA